MTKNVSKIAYLDGIRGLAALLVVFHHFLLAFYPAHFSFDPRVSHLNGWDVKYGHSVFSVLSNGHFYVCVFFVLSGYVLSRRYFRSGNIEIVVSSAIRRFPRLYIPVAFTLILSYLLLVSGAYHNVEASTLTHCEDWLGKWWSFSDPFRQLCKNLLVSTMFRGDNSFDTALWTMSIELAGSFFVFTYLALTHNARHRFILLLFSLLYCKLTANILMATFVLGISLNYVEDAVINLGKTFITLAAIVLLALGLVLGSFPTTGITEGTLFAHLPPVIMQFSNSFHGIGAFALVLAFVMSATLQRIISQRFFIFLGRISFALYLLHPLVIGSVSCIVFLGLIKSLSYNEALSLVFFITIVICMLASWLMAKYIDEPGIRLGKKLYDRWIRKDHSEKTSF